MKTIKIPTELHNKLKMTAMSKNISLQDLVIRIINNSITSSKPATTPSELSSELKDFYSKNMHFVESTRTLMNCSLEEAILVTMEAESELKKFNL
jgi:hypothetical protein